jgi:L-2-hydroxyglutarate oxidase LhgO
MQNKVWDLIIIGGGAVGLSVAYQILKRTDGALSVLVLEKEKEVSEHQTGHNSGVIHSGLYYRPGSKRALLCTKGREMLYAFAQEYEVPHERCGKIVVAVTEEEIPYLETIFNRGLENGLTGLKWMDPQEINSVEPYCEGKKAIFVPQTGIIDFKRLCLTLKERIQELGGVVRTKSEVVGIQRDRYEYTIYTPHNQFKCRFLISCAGLQSDRIAQMEGLSLSHRIVGFRGDYYELVGEGKKRVRNLIYPVPNPQFPFLGVHFTRMINGEIEVGPNAVFTFKREGYGKTDFDWKDTWDALSFSGTWSFFFKHWKFGLEEYQRAFSKKRFYQKVRQMIPSLRIEELKPGRSGVRAMALSKEGEMIDDFLFAETEHSIHVLNAPSPAATACLAIGEYISQRAEEQFFFTSLPTTSLSL